MNRYPLWKYALVLIVLGIGIIYALPNVFGRDPAVQVSVKKGDLPAATADRVSSTLADVEIEPNGMRQRDESLLVRFADGDMQDAAKAAIRKALSDDYVVASNRVSAAPAWLRSIGGDPVSLGLDLRGGVHFLLEVDMDSAIKKSLKQDIGDLRRFMRENEIRYRGITLSDGEIRIHFPDSDQRASAADQLASQYDGLRFSKDSSDAGLLLADMSDKARKSQRETALKQNITTLRNRVNELGVAEPVVTQQGDNRIVVQLPGVRDTTRAKEILGSTSTLEFHLVHGKPADWQEAASGGDVPFQAKLYKRRDGPPILLKRQVIVTGDQIKDANASFDNRSGQPITVIKLNNTGANHMQEVTSEHVGDEMAVVFIKNEVETKKVDGEDVTTHERTTEVINVATIQDVLSHRFQVQGLSGEESRKLALLLRAGALSAPIEIIQERTIGPSLGQDNVNEGINSIIVGMLLVVGFIVLYYGVFGLMADIALAANLVLITAILSILPATLTLPGIAGIVLTVGMAVDANVLIFERIREEVRAGNSAQASIHSGFDKAFGTIADANATTLIAAIVLFSFGSGPIKGFAVTLSIGILTSMFSAIMGTRALVNLVYGGRRLNRLPI